MGINKLSFLLILLFGFSIHTMEQGEGKTEDSYNITEEISVAGEYDDEIQGTYDIVEEEVDLPPLDLFLNGRNLLKVRTILEQLKESKRRKRNILKDGILLHGPAGTGKFTIAQIISKESGWDLIALEANDLAQGHQLFEEEEYTDEQPIKRKLKIITKNLDLGDDAEEHIHIKRTLKSLLLMIRKKPTILFLHNLENLINNNDSSVLTLFIDIFKKFRPFVLAFLMASTRNSALITNPLIIDLVKPMQIDLPNYKKRTNILEYYFLKNLIDREIEGSITAHNIQDNISIAVFDELITATNNFSGSDIEEMVQNAACALNKHIPNTNKVSAFFISKNELDLRNRTFSSIFFYPFFPVIYGITVIIRPLGSREEEEYLLSFCAIQQDEIAWKQSITLKDKISKKRLCWNFIKLTTNDGIKKGIMLGAFILKAGALLGGGIGTLSAPVLAGISQSVTEESARYAGEKLQQLLPPIQEKYKEKDKDS